MPLSPYQQIQQVKDHYDTIGLHFAETRRKKMQEELIPFVKKIKPGMRVLDVGCGSGRLLSELEGKKINYVGIDFSQTLIDQAKTQFPKNRFLLADISKSDSWQKLGKFDAIFCLGVLHHIPDRRRQHVILQRMFQHLNPDGFMFISIWNLWHFRFLKLHIRQWRKKWEYKNLSFIWVPYSVSDGKKIVKRVRRFCKAYLPGELIQLVKQVGFRVDTYYYAAKGKTHLSIFKGDNFCLLAKKIF